MEPLKISFCAYGGGGLKNTAPMSQWSDGAHHGTERYPLASYHVSMSVCDTDYDWDTPDIISV